jgi:adenylyl-sulfate kinase
VKRSWLIWLTGLSGAGKSSLAEALVERLRARNVQVFHLDGDRFRRILGNDLGFTAADRAENLRRASSVASLLVEGGTAVVAAFISPCVADRDSIRALFPSGTFVEVFVRCPLEVCEERDTKGLYARARRGEIADFTGISAPYEEPTSAEMVIDTNEEALEACVSRLEALALQLQLNVGTAACFSSDY